MRDQLARLPLPTGLLASYCGMKFDQLFSSLQNDEAEDEEPCGEESGNDGFFVADGQLSEDEGLSSVQQDIDMLCAEQEGVAAS